MNSKEENKTNMKELEELPVHKEDKYFIIKKTTLYAIAAILVVLYLVGFSIGTIVTLNKQSDEIVSLKQQIISLNSNGNNNSSVVEELDITQMDYYKDLEITKEKYDELVNSKQDFMLYFHSDTCHYCKEANVFLNQFISLGYSEKAPIYFVTDGSIFDTEKVEETPTMVEYKADGTKTNYVGSDEIFNLLDTKVAEQNGK